jgi:hypothetical protein
MLRAEFGRSDLEDDLDAEAERQLCERARRETGIPAVFVLDFLLAARPVTCTVSIGPRDGGGFGLAVKIHVEDKSIQQAELAALVKEAHEQICPYSHAARGNVNVEREVAGS